MGLILDGDSEIGAHVRIDLGYLICSRHLLRLRAVTNSIFVLKATLFPSRLPRKKQDIPEMSPTKIFVVDFFKRE